MGHTLGIVRLNAFVWDQSVPVDDVLIPHNRKDLHPRVVLIDEEGDQFEAEIQYPNQNTIRVLTTTPLTFTAYIY